MFEFEVECPELELELPMFSSFFRSDKPELAHLSHWLAVSSFDRVLVELLVVDDDFEVVPDPAADS